ncbi:zinc ribbon domain-containing protein [Halorubrum yunnanense]|uniref:Zinc ribbon domain-containing protein n=1 Tax=Halorubrum yunnanense TaxID=1526162 RepID=A0ABD5YIU7_9EURY|nr:zinc ribbon domain-containing protein [Halorubrum yunnanense]
MTGGTLLPVASVFTAVIAANLALAWLLARRDWERPEILGSAGDSSPSESESGPGAHPDGSPAAGPEFAADADTGSSATGTVPDGDPPSIDVDGETVVCQHCGAENRSDFRYCRWCVRSGFPAQGSGAVGGSGVTEGSP